MEFCLWFLFLPFPYPPRIYRESLFLFCLQIQSEWILIFTLQFEFSWTSKKNCHSDPGVFPCHLSRVTVLQFIVGSSQRCFIRIIPHYIIWRNKLSPLTRARMKALAIDCVLWELSEAYSMEKRLSGHWAQIVYLASKEVRGLGKRIGIKKLWSVRGEVRLFCLWNLRLKCFN